MVGEWTSCRLRPDTLARLKRFAKRLKDSAAIRHIDEVGQRRKGIINMDVAVTVLLAREELRALRSEKSKSS